jgi:hypothetical protein
VGVGVVVEMVVGVVDVIDVVVVVGMCEIKLESASHKHRRTFQISKTPDIPDHSSAQAPEAVHKFQ